MAPSRSTTLDGGRKHSHGLEGRCDRPGQFLRDENSQDIVAFGSQAAEGIPKGSDGSLRSGWHQPGFFQAGIKFIRLDIHPSRNVSFPDQFLWNDRNMVFLHQVIGIYAVLSVTTATLDRFLLITMMGLDR
jgi:hypothetical protein